MLLSANPLATPGLEAPPDHDGRLGSPYDGGAHPIIMSHGPDASAWLTDAQYAWTESALTEIFFLIVTAVAVPIWVIRLRRHLKTPGPFTS